MSCSHFCTLCGGVAFLEEAGSPWLSHYLISRQSELPLAQDAEPYGTNHLHNWGTEGVSSAELGLKSRQARKIRNILVSWKHVCKTLCPCGVLLGSICRVKKNSSGEQWLNSVVPPPMWPHPCPITWKQLYWQIY